MSQLNDQKDQKDQTITNRRTFLARVAEASACAPLAAAAATSWHKQSQYSELQLHRARMTEPSVARPEGLEGLFSSQSEFANAAARLEAAYTDSYRRTSIIMMPQMIGKTVTLRPQSQTSWHEPDALPHHSLVAEWRSAQSDMRDKVLGITQHSLIDIHKLGEISIQAKMGDETARHILTGLVYGSSAALLLGYEEIAALARARKNDTNYHHERYGTTTPAKETRRGILKSIAALAGLGAALPIHGQIDDRLKSGEARLQGRLSEASQSSRNISVGAATYFGTTIEDIRNKVVNQVEICELALVSGQASEPVAAAFTSFLEAGKRYAEWLQAVSNNIELTEMLGYLAQCRITTTELEKSSKVDERLATIAALVEGMGISASIAATLVIGSKLAGSEKE